MAEGIERMLSDIEKWISSLLMKSYTFRVFMS